MLEKTALRYPFPMVSESSRVRKLTNYKAVAVSLGVILFAVVLFVFSLNDALWGGQQVAPAVLTELGGLLAVSASLTLLWELGAKREFLDEVWHKAVLSNSVKESGFIDAVDYTKLNWSGDLLEDIKRLDVFFVGGTTWRKTNSVSLKKLEKTKGAEVNLFLPDPNNEAVVAELERRFEDDTKDEVLARINNTKTFFGKMRDNAKEEDGAVVNVWFVPFAPAYTLFRCGGKFVFTPYRHRPSGEEDTVPAFVFGPGEMHDFFEREFKYLRRTGKNAFDARGLTNGNGAP